MTISKRKVENVLFAPDPFSSMCRRTFIQALLRKPMHCWRKVTLPSFETVYIEVFYPHCGREQSAAIFFKIGTEAIQQVTGTLVLLLFPKCSSMVNQRKNNLHSPRQHGFLPARFFVTNMPYRRQCDASIRRRNDPTPHPQWLCKGFDRIQNILSLYKIESCGTSGRILNHPNFSHRLIVYCQRWIFTIWSLFSPERNAVRIRAWPLSFPQSRKRTFLAISWENCYFLRWSCHPGYQACSSVVSNGSREALAHWL